MKYSTIKRNINDSFDSTMDFFSQKIFGNYWEGEDFIHDFGEFLDSTKFPCDKITLNPFGCCSNEFEIIFKYDNNRVCWFKFSVNKQTKIMAVESCTFEDKTIEKMFKRIINDYIRQFNTDVFRTQMEKCNLKTTSNVTIVVDVYNDYEPDGKQQTLEGTLQDIFEQYTTHNDRLKYVNGSYWAFSDRNVAMLYGMFIQMYNGNYFLDNAVKRGVTID
jgi:hypothetical protein